MSTRESNKLPPKARKFFKAFLVAPTLWKKEVHSLHPKDWQKFYIFLRHCAQYNVSLTTSNFQKLLEENNFSEELTEEIVTVFKHGRRLLKLQ